MAPGKEFHRISTIEPKLMEMYQFVTSIDPSMDGSFCANEIWYRDLKPLLLTLVGHYSEVDAISDARSYDVAYQTIYRALPNCRHEGAICGPWRKVAVQ